MIALNALRKLSWFGLIVCVLAGTACQTQPPEQAAAPPSHEAMVARGEYLVTILGCNDCHTPWKMGPNGPEPDMSRMLSGHPKTLELPPPPKLPA